jgi:hypothetical protein
MKANDKLIITDANSFWLAVNQVNIIPFYGVCPGRPLLMGHGDGSCMQAYVFV